MGFDVYSRAANTQHQGSSSAAPLVSPISCGSVAAIGAATEYLNAIGANKSASQVPLFLATRDCTIQNLGAVCGTAPGGSDTAICTVQVSTDKGATYTDTALTVTVPAAGTATYDAAHQVAIAKGSLLAVKCVSSGATAAAVMATFEVV